ncbi:MAG: 2,3-diketo-5-methylthiopentyl-1-phosphate enolase [Candidatus Firestonebacteria bacterium]
MLDPKIFVGYEGIDKENYIIGLYLFEGESEDILKKVEAIALEQSTGTWMDVPKETEEIREKCVARVLGVYEIPQYEDALPKDVKERKILFLIGFPKDNINGQIPQMLTALYGNISMAGKLKLLDVFLPESFAKKFKGPKFGIEGIRKILNVYDRPILIAMFKPCVGLDPKTLGNLLYELGVGGVDIIKDDELLADPEFCKVEERLEECLKACEKVYKKTGRKVLYSINITDNFDKMFKKAKNAVKNGANCLMVNVYTVSFSALSVLAEDSEINVPILAHPDFAGAFFGSPQYGLSSNLVLGKLVRLSGADMVIYPSYFGKVPMVKERVIRIAQELTSPFYHLKRVFPGPSAGMHPGLVPQTIKDFGHDVILGAGGGIHAHPLGAISGAKAFHQAMDAVKKNIPLKEYAKKHKELKIAIEKWGMYEDKSNIYTLTK